MVKVVRGDPLLEEQAVFVNVTISPQMVVRVKITKAYVVSVHIKKSLVEILTSQAAVCR